MEKGIYRLKSETKNSIRVIICNILTNANNKIKNLRKNTIHNIIIIKKNKQFLHENSNILVLQDYKCYKTIIMLKDKYKVKMLNGTTSYKSEQRNLT